jgi:hypothetical protein
MLLHEHTPVGSEVAIGAHLYVEMKQNNNCGLY